MVLQVTYISNSMGFLTYTYYSGENTRVMHGVYEFKNNDSYSYKVYSHGNGIGLSKSGKKGIFYNLVYYL